MQIIGCDLHARQQTLAMLDTVTGEVVNRTLMHEGKEVRELYSQLAHPVLVGIEAIGPMQWFLNLLEELGIECQVDSEVVGGETVSGDLDAQQGTARSARLVVASASVGACAHAATKCPAGHRVGQRIATRSRPVELRRASKDRVLAPAATHLFATECIANSVSAYGRRNRKTDGASCRASRASPGSTVAYDPSRSGAGYGVGHGCVFGRPAAVRRW